ncbi:sulfite exporter TauE/SafE family protein [Ichthyobacterium seriolicida]|uniref:Probable membrane transporter protein n=1 Tax=Ichthyobacterium seriolicida TaxID=242600 RepID=A0A1J1E1L7_9FLAO|nr:sulfite exporter TauE/SafE family protein [Ichthyobacterium seriolicida]BAV94845.1 permease [Ichthyobacterium seriolicida]
MDMITVLLLVFVGICAGVLSGLTGVGGGIIMIPLLILFFGVSQFKAQGISLAAMLPPIGIMAVINYYKQGMVEVKFAVVISIAFVIGAFLGSKIALSLNQRTVKIIFGALLVFCGLKTILNK